METLGIIVAIIGVVFSVGGVVGGWILKAIWSRLDKLEAETDARFAALEQRLYQRETLDAMFKDMHGQMANLNSTMTDLAKSIRESDDHKWKAIKEIDRRVTHLEVNRQ